MMNNLCINNLLLACKKFKRIALNPGNYSYFHNELSKKYNLTEVFFNYSPGAGYTVYGCNIYWNVDVIKNYIMVSNDEHCKEGSDYKWSPLLNLDTENFEKILNYPILW